MMRGKEDESSEEDWQSHGSAVSGVDSWAGSAGSLSPESVNLVHQSKYPSV